MLQGEVNLR